MRSDSIVFNDEHRRLDKVCSFVWNCRASDLKRIFLVLISALFFEFFFIFNENRTMDLILQLKSELERIQTELNNERDNIQQLRDELQAERTRAPDDIQQLKGEL